MPVDADQWHKTPSLELRPPGNRADVFVGFLSAGNPLRNMIVEAWLDSANTPIRYPMVNVRDIESGKVRATRELFGAD